MSKIANYIKGAREEIAKVVWPSRETTTQHTLVVIGISVVVAVFLGGIDFLLNRVLQFLI